MTTHYLNIAAIIFCIADISLLTWFVFLNFPQLPVPHTKWGFMNNDTQQDQTAEQKLFRLAEGMVPPPIVLPDEQKGMVPVTFIPPIIQQTTQTDAGQASQQTTSIQQSTITQQTQSSEQSQSNENKWAPYSTGQPKPIRPCPCHARGKREKLAMQQTCISSSLFHPSLFVKGRLHSILDLARCDPNLRAMVHEENQENMVHDIPSGPSTD